MGKLPPPAGGTQNSKLKTQNLDDSMVSTPSTPQVSSDINGTGPGLMGKEQDFFEKQDNLQIEEIRKELEFGPELKEAGLEVRHEEINLPPPISKMGVSATGTAAPMVVSAVNLPLTDDKVVNGLGAKVTQSLLWLANWCLRQLKKTHIKLKKVKGKIVRVITK